MAVPPAPTDADQAAAIWRAEDWWAAGLGVAFVLGAFTLFFQGYPLGWLIVRPARWAAAGELGANLAENAHRYAAQFAAMLAVFSVAARAMGRPLLPHTAGFALIYVLALGAQILGQSPWAGLYDIDTPVCALVIGLVVANVLLLPRALDTAFRVEFYVMFAIVLVGASFPLSLLVWASPIALVQAACVSVCTFFVVFWIASFLELDRKLAAMLAAGGAICGVSAVVVIAGAVRARREHLPVAIGVVVIWAIALIVGLPMLARAWHLPAGVAGAWFGSSQLTDAAGFATAAAYSPVVRSGAVAGSADQTVLGFVMMKVIGRDLWIGIWSAP